jgi:hypothetical protein
MFGVASLLVVVLLSLLITRVATVALVATGLSRSTARFQARSAFTGTRPAGDEGDATHERAVEEQTRLALAETDADEAETAVR